MLAPRTPELDTIEHARSRALLRRNMAAAAADEQRMRSFEVAVLRLEYAWERIAQKTCFSCHRGGHHFQRCPR